MHSKIIKIAIFTTGVSGIVAEYILSTLASYFIGDSITQWALIISTMLFSMGIGSRISKRIDGNLIFAFIVTEFILSVLISYSTLFTYLSIGKTQYYGIVIYSLSIAIGMLIGLEIPLVIRINKSYQNLKVNISSVLEKDYYGSLLGGLFFSFVGLPYLGLTYTPIILGSLNFIIAIAVFVILKDQLLKHHRRWIVYGIAFVTLVFIFGIFYTEPIILSGEQKNYKDKIIYSEQSRYQKIVITSWKDDFWLFINNNQQLSSLDEFLYHEPLVHPAISLLKNPKDVLVFGGGDGCAAREILKYESVNKIHLVDIDPAMTNLGKNNPILKDLNDNAMNDDRVIIINEDAFKYLEHDKQYYDLIIIDLPDPKSIELSRLYSFEFYKMCHHSLRPNGIIVTQAASPYYSPKVFKCIEKTLQAASFSTLKLHNQVLTLGEWGWVIGAKSLNEDEIMRILKSTDFNQIDNKWLNNEAINLITSFGKNVFIDSEDSIHVNKIHDPVLPKYYRDGAWDIY
jgi:spermidine synthase